MGLPFTVFLVFNQLKQKIISLISVGKNKVTLISDYYTEHQFPQRENVIAKYSNKEKIL